MEDFKIIKNYLKERIEIDSLPDGFGKGMSEGTIKHKNSDVLMALARLERALEKQSNENAILPISHVRGSLLPRKKYYWPDTEMANGSGDFTQSSKLIALSIQTLGKLIQDCFQEPEQ